MYISSAFGCTLCIRISIRCQKYAFIKKSTIFTQCGTHEYLIFTKFRNDLVKIVDFLIKAYFWQSIDSPDTQCKTQNGLDKNQVHWFLRFHLQKIIIYSMQVTSIIIYLECLSWPKNIQYFMRIHHSKFLSHTTNKKMGQTPSRFWLKGIDVAVLLCDKF